MTLRILTLVTLHEKYSTTSAQSDAKPLSVTTPEELWEFGDDDDVADLVLHLAEERTEERRYYRSAGTHPPNTGPGCYFEWDDDET